MTGSKSDIIARLQREILPLQGFKPGANNKLVDIGLGPVKQAFPNSEFPLGVIHAVVFNERGLFRIINPVTWLCSTAN